MPVPKRYRKIRRGETEGRLPASIAGKWSRDTEPRPSLAKSSASAVHRHARRNLRADMAAAISGVQFTGILSARTKRNGMAPGTTHRRCGRQYSAIPACQEDGISARRLPADAFQHEVKLMRPGSPGDVQVYHLPGSHVNDWYHRMWRRSRGGDEMSLSRIPHTIS